MSEFDARYRTCLEKLSTTNVADALDALGLKGATYGIRPVWESAGKVVGRAITVKITAAGLTIGQGHLGVKAIDAATPGDVIIIDNGGRLDTNCWGGILSNGARMKGVSGVVVDGAVRDVEDCMEAKVPVYARGTVVATARGRVMEEATNVMIQFGGIQVRPGDVVVGDRSGVVIIPHEKLDQVVAKAQLLYDQEEAMVAEIRAGVSMLEVDRKYAYEKMLK